EEDLRLLYVALTRARHFLWLGVAAVASPRGGGNQLHESALGYLLGGGLPIAASDLGAALARLRGEEDAIELRMLPSPEGLTMLSRPDTAPPLAEAARFTGQFERDWSVGSFTSLTRQTNAAPMRAQDETLLEEEGNATPQRTEDAPWHRFPRGSVPGNFLHEQLEWLAGEGFASVDEARFEERIGQRIARAGWDHRREDTVAWMRALAATVLPPLQASLSDLERVLPEMEFWFPSQRLDARALERLCAARVLEGAARAPLPERRLHGMLKGFADLVFEHDGKYWILDYKSNALGPGDAAYSRAAMAQAMAAHYYDVQGALYQLALHRLLQSRLDDAYVPERHLGGAVFLFLRGIANPQTHGCFLLAPDAGLLADLDRMMRGEDGTA
ncbi:MAG TPA: PD-(D/E)XK nuclease family protein, partial [Telluria sp.]|nr:PD-(D/E)XK nuclease family protein [Telluria sp.]